MLDAVMFDIEAFGNNPARCAIAQIGAVWFDIRTGETGKTFKRNIDVRSTVKVGAELEADTVYWWLDQDKAAQKSLTNGGLCTVAEALYDFKQFVFGANEMWSHSTYDAVNVYQFYTRLLNIDPPFQMKKCMDIRTLMRLSGLSAKAFERDGIHHDALADALHQVKYVTAAYQELMGQ
jgi:hypothetical protein